jgi:hypothetical protein
LENDVKMRRRAKGTWKVILKCSGNKAAGIWFGLNW